FGVSASPSRLGSSPSSASSCLIRSCILLFYISTLTAQPAQRARDASSTEADRLYADRANLSSARRAATSWREELAAGGSGAFDAAWKLARADYWLGGHSPEAERRKQYEEGIDAGRKAVALQPNRPAGYFWLA